MSAADHPQANRCALQHSTHARRVLCSQQPAALPRAAGLAHMQPTVTGCTPRSVATCRPLHRMVLTPRPAHAHLTHACLKYPVCSSQLSSLRKTSLCVFYLQDPGLHFSRIALQPLQQHSPWNSRVIQGFIVGKDQCSMVGSPCGRFLQGIPENQSRCLSFIFVLLCLCFVSGFP